MIIRILFLTLFLSGCTAIQKVPNSISMGPNVQDNPMIIELTFINH